MLPDVLGVPFFKLQFLNGLAMLIKRKPYQNNLRSISLKIISRYFRVSTEDGFSDLHYIHLAHSS